MITTSHLQIKYKIVIELILYIIAAIYFFRPIEYYKSTSRCCVLSPQHEQYQIKLSERRIRYVLYVVFILEMVTDNYIPPLYYTN